MQRTDVYLFGKKRNIASLETPDEKRKKILSKFIPENTVIIPGDTKYIVYFRKIIILKNL